MESLNDALLVFDVEGDGKKYLNDVINKGFLFMKIVFEEPEKIRKFV